MTMLFAIVFLLVFGAENLVGIATNAFIVAVNLLNWAKGTVLIATDQVLLSLGLSNLCVQGTSAVVALSFFFYKELFYKGFGSQVFSFFFVFSSSISIWLTGVLLLSYYLMMNNTLHPLFLWMKKILINNIFWILSFSFLVAFGFGLLASHCRAMDVPHDVAANLTSNFSKPFIPFCNSIQFRVNLVLLPFIWPIVTTSLFVTQILTDIWKHIWNIKKTMPGTSEPNLEVYRNATTTLTVLLILYLCFSLIIIANIFNIFSYYNIWFLISTTMYSILTSVQAVTFILGTTNLKMEAQRILQSFRLFTAVEHGQSAEAISYVTTP